MPESQKINLLSSDNMPLIGRLLEVENAKAVVLIAPATAVPQRYYKPFAEWLAKKGYTSMSIDYRGVGESAPEKLSGFEAKMQDWGLDFEAAALYLLEKYPHLPLNLLGHSVGSQLLGFFSENNRVAKAVFVATSTGYWRDFSPISEKWKLWFFLNIMIPLSTFTLGYAATKRFGFGENLPAGVALQWRKWCQHPYYLQVDLPHIAHNYFAQYTGFIHSIWFSDDPISHEFPVKKLLTLFPSAKNSVEEINPNSVGLKKIGHIGFFDKKNKEILWERVLAHFEIQR